RTTSRAPSSLPSSVRPPKKSSLQLLLGPDSSFVCTPTKEESGPNNNWSDPTETYAKLRGWLEGSMQGRSMYVIPYVMGPLGSRFSKVGVEITDSIYVALSMRTMTRMGQA